MVAGIGGVALFVFLFFDWFSGGGAFDEGGGISGWDGLGGDFSGFIVALTSVAGVTLAVLAMAGRRVNIPVPRGGVTATLGTLSVLIILWRFFANPGDLKIGIFLGLAAAVAIAVGAIIALREDGVEPLVAAAGARARTASASAPPATPAPAAATPVAAKSTSSGGSSTTTRSTTTKRSASGGSSTRKRSTTKRSTTKGSTTRKSSSRSGAKRSSGSRSTSRSRSSGSKTTSSRSRSTSSKGRSSSRSSSRSGGSRRSSGRKK
jgi:hypothetical protein